MGNTIWDGSTDGDWGTAANWSDGVPATGDIAIIPSDAMVNIAGSDETASPFDQLVVEEGCAITLGSATAYLQLSMSGETACSAELWGEGQTYMDIVEAKAIRVYHAAASPGAGQFGLNLKGLTATNNPTLDVMCSSGESVGIAANAGEAGEYASIRVTGGDVTIGTVTESDGATAPDVVVSGGDVVTESPMGAVDVLGGVVNHYGGAITTLTIQDATFYQRGVGTITNCIQYAGSTLDASKDLRARTITNHTMGPQSTLVDPQKTITFTNGIDLSRARYGDVTIDRGYHFTITPSAI